MKQLIILMTLFTCITAQAQKATPPGKIFIGLNFSPDYSFRTLSNNEGDASVGLVIASRNEIEIAKFGYTTGGNISFASTDKFRFETGIQYSNKGYRIKKRATGFAQPDPTAPIAIRLMYGYQYLGIPLQATFIFGKNKFRFHTGFGLMANLLLESTVTSYEEYANGRTGKTVESAGGYRSIDVSPMINLGVDYTLTKKIYLSAEPTFRYGILSTRDAPIAEHLWSAGLNLGIHWRLK